MLKRTVAISGASSGFGRLGTIALARAGHTVFATVRNLAEAQAAQREYGALRENDGLDIIVLEMDVTDQTSVDRCIAEILGKASDLDVFIHNAGHMNFGPTEAFTPEQCAALYDVNAIGTQRINRTLLPYMRRRGQGLLLWVSSSSVKGGYSPFFSPYFAAKAAMEQLAAGYALELAPFGIETTILVPGVFTKGTEHFAHGMTPGDPEVAREYEEGPLAGVSDTLLAGVGRMEPPDSDPQWVADAMVNIVEAALGHRPFRVHVDPADDGSAVVAAVADRLRLETLRRCDLEYLTRATPRSSSG